MPITTAAAQSAAAYAPATIANLGVGFDIVGLALAEPGDIVRAAWSETPGITVTEITGDGGKLSRDPAKNTASVAAASVLRAAAELRGIQPERGISLSIEKGLPLASGMGSSAASAVAGAVAANALLANALLGSPLSKAELLPACLDGEAMASGYHADNAAPCLFGGILLIYGTRASQMVSLPIPENLWFALVTPGVEVPTALARAALPQSIPLKTMVAQTAGVGRLIDAIHRGDLEAMAAAMESDTVIEAARAHLMPLLAEVRAAAKAAGALGLAISGAGPTLCAVCDRESVAARVVAAMATVYEGANIPCRKLWTQVAADGASVV
jgi:homoserine kinase